MTSDAPLKSRVGRPRREEAGDVSARILAAATELFLEKGVAATSCEAVAARARVSKVSLYARYTGKDALFVGVVRHAVDGTILRPDVPSLSGGTVRDRLRDVGTAVLIHATSPVPLDLMRLFLTEARRSPDLIAQVDRMARTRVIDMVSGAILARTEDSALRDRADDLAERFLDLTFAPIMLAVLTGRQAAPAIDEIEHQIARAIDLLESAGLLSDATFPH